MKRTAAPRPRPGFDHWICVNCGEWAVFSCGREETKQRTDFGLCPNCLEEILASASIPFAEPTAFSVAH